MQLLKRKYVTHKTPTQYVFRCYVCTYGFMCMTINHKVVEFSRVLIENFSNY